MSIEGTILRIAYQAERGDKHLNDNYDAVEDWHRVVKPRLDAIERRQKWQRRAKRAAMLLAAAAVWAVVG